MAYHRTNIDSCHLAEGFVVAIDVLRAFSTAAYALAGGAREILLTGSIEQAFALRDQYPDYLLMGEANGLLIPGFDLSNSPGEIQEKDLDGRGLIQRTSAGTQGIVRSVKATSWLASSFVVASATARAIRQISPETVTFVITGLDSDRSKHEAFPWFGDEDAACADYIEKLLAGEKPDSASYLQRVRDSAPGQIFVDPKHPEFQTADLELCTAVDRFDFALAVQRRNGLFAMNRMETG
jgi:2-phosphosulfolactate phosphatase